MEYILVGVVVAAALACPVLMCGPMLLRRVGILKGGSADMSCMGTLSSKGAMADQRVRDLKTRRTEIDAEIARIQPNLGEGASNQLPPQVNSPHSTKPA